MQKILKFSLQRQGLRQLRMTHILTDTGGIGLPLPFTAPHEQIHRNTFQTYGSSPQMEKPQFTVVIPWDIKLTAPAALSRGVLNEYRNIGDNRNVTISHTGLRVWPG